MSPYETEVITKAKRLKAAGSEWSVTITFPSGPRASRIADELIVSAIKRDLVVQFHEVGSLLSKRRVVRLKGDPETVAVLTLVAQRTLPGFTVEED